MFWCESTSPTLAPLSRRYSRAWTLLNLQGWYHTGRLATPICNDTSLREESRTHCGGNIPEVISCFANVDSFPRAQHLCTGHTKKCRSCFNRSSLERQPTVARASADRRSSVSRPSLERQPTVTRAVAGLPIYRQNRLKPNIRKRNGRF